MSDIAKLPRAPRGLGTGGKNLWRESVREFEFNQAELSILESACRTWDTIAVLQKAIDGMGSDIRVKGSTGQWVQAPEFAEIRQQMQTLKTLLTTLYRLVPTGASESGGGREVSASGVVREAKFNSAPP